MLNFLKAIKLLCASFSALTSVFGLRPNDDNKFTYVSLGDSMTTGFGFDDYYIDDEVIPGNVLEYYRVEDGFKNVRGFLRTAQEAYPNLVYNYLANKYGEGNVDHIQLAVNSSRIDDVYYFLNKEATYDEYYELGFKDGWNNIFANRARQYGYSENQNDDEALNETYVNAIKKADLITLNSGFNNFGCFISGKICDIIKNFPISYSFYGHDTLQSFLDRNHIKLNVSKLYSDICNIVSRTLNIDITSYEEIEISGLTIDVKYTIEIILLAFVSYCYYMNETTKLILDLNPDVELIVVGLYNPVRDINLLVDGTIISAKDIADKLFGIANLYAQIGTEKCDKYKFVDTKNLEVPLHIDDMKNGTMNESQKRRAYIAIYNIANEFGITVPTFIDVKNQINETIATPNFNISDYMIDEESNDLSDANAYCLRWLASSEVFGAETAAIINTILNEYYDTLDSFLLILKRSVSSEFIDMSGISLLGSTIALEDLNNGDFDGALNIYIRILLSNGMWSHPNKEGHVVLSEAIINSLESKKTAKDVGLDNLRLIFKEISNIVESLITELKKEGKLILINYVGEEFSEKIIEFIDHQLSITKRIVEIIDVLNFLRNFILKFQEISIEFNNLLIKLQDSMNGLPNCPIFFNQFFRIC